MAHNIHKMVFVGEEPWHKQGVRLPTKAPFEEIVEAAGFYEAVERPVFIPPFNAPIPDKKALVRGDTGAYLSVVGKSYEVVQFSEVARTLVEASGDVKAVFTTAGTLGPVGIRGWLLGELPGALRVRGDDSPIRKYVLGCAGHDGYTAVVIKNCATRVVCQNTLGVALGERGGATWRIQHTASAKERLVEAGKAFRRIAESYTTFGDLANVMAVTKFTPKQMVSTIDSILPVKNDDRDHRRLLTEREKVMRLYETAVGVEKLRGSAWGAFQSWVEYADFHRALRDTGRQDPKRARLESIWLGRSAAMKQAALTAIANESGIQLTAA